VVAILWYMGEKPILKKIIHHGRGVERKGKNASEQNIIDNLA